jgi:hypothetical protein
MRIYLQLAFLMPYGLLAQIAHTEVIGASGKTLSSPGFVVSFTLGEVMIDTRRDTVGGFVLTEGFQQSYFRVTSVYVSPISEFELKVFPNPTLRYLHLEYNSQNPQTPIAQILDLQGVVLLEEIIESKHVLDLQPLQGHAFVLRIYSAEAGDLAIYKILKR